LLTIFDFVRGWLETPLLSGVKRQNFIPLAEIVVIISARADAEHLRAASFSILQSGDLRPNAGNKGGHVTTL